MNKMVFVFLRNFMVSFVTAVLVLAPLTYLFWPGKTSHDTVVQISQALGFIPMSVLTIVFMTLLIKLSIFKSTGTIVYFLFQSLIVALASSLGISILLTTFLPDLRGTKRYFLVFMITFFICVFPPVGLMNVILWKDIPFSWCAFLLIACSVSISYIYFNSKGQVELQKGYLNLIFYLSTFACSIMICYRLNASTLVIPFFLIICILYFLINKKIQSFKNILIASACIIFSFSLQFYLVNKYVPNDIQKSFHNITSWNMVVTNIFGVMLHNGYRLDEKDRILLEQYIDIDSYVKNVNPANSYYQWTTNYSKIPDFWLAQRKFVYVGQKALFKNPIQSLLINFNYYLEYISSFKGFQIPIFDETNLEPLIINGVHLTMNPRYSKYRDLYVRLMGKNGGFFHVTRLAWTYWPEFIIQLLFLCLIIYYKFFNKNNKIKKMHLYMHSFKVVICKNKITLVLPILASMFLSFPLMAILINNDFRYFLANIFFTYTLLLVFIFLFFNELKIQKNFSGKV